MKTHRFKHDFKEFAEQYEELFLLYRGLEVENVEFIDQYHKFEGNEIPDALKPLVPHYERLIDVKQLYTDKSKSVFDSIKVEKKAPQAIQYLKNHAIKNFHSDNWVPRPTTELNKNKNAHIGGHKKMGLGKIKRKVELDKMIKHNKNVMDIFKKSFANTLQTVYERDERPKRRILKQSFTKDVLIAPHFSGFTKNNGSKSISKDKDSDFIELPSAFIVKNSSRKLMTAASISNTEYDKYDKNEYEHSKNESILEKQSLNNVRVEASSSAKTIQFYKEQNNMQPVDEPSPVTSTKPLFLRSITTILPKRESSNTNVSKITTTIKLEQDPNISPSNKKLENLRKRPFSKDLKEESKRFESRQTESIGKKISISLNNSPIYAEDKPAFRQINDQRLFKRKESSSKNRLTSTNNENSQDGIDEKDNTKDTECIGDVVSNYFETSEKLLEAYYSTRTTNSQSASKSGDKNSINKPYQNKSAKSFLRSQLELIDDERIMSIDMNKLTPTTPHVNQIRPFSMTGMSSNLSSSSSVPNNLHARGHSTATSNTSLFSVPKPTYKESITYNLERMNLSRTLTYLSSLSKKKMSKATGNSDNIQPFMFLAKDIYTGIQDVKRIQDKHKTSELINDFQKKFGQAPESFEKHRDTIQENKRETDNVENGLFSLLHKFKFL